MNRIVALWLFTFLSFLLWFYLAANYSTVDDWWTVKAINEIRSNNKNITIISPINYAISSIKVLIGSAVFILLGTLLSCKTMEKIRKT